MTTTSLSQILIAVNDLSNYDEHTVTDIVLTSPELSDVVDFDSTTYEYLLEWA